MKTKFIDIEKWINIKHYNSRYHSVNFLLSWGGKDLDPRLRFHFLFIYHLLHRTPVGKRSEDPPVLLHLRSQLEGPHSGSSPGNFGIGRKSFWGYRPVQLLTHCALGPGSCSQSSTHTSEEAGHFPATAELGGMFGGNAVLLLPRWEEDKRYQVWWWPPISRIFKFKFKKFSSY